MIRSAVLIQSARVTDGQTDRRTDGRMDGIAVAYRLTRYNMLSCVKIMQEFNSGMLTYVVPQNVLKFVKILLNYGR